MIVLGGLLLALTAAARVPEVFALGGLYAYIIGKTALEEVINRPLWGEIVSVQREAGVDGKIRETARVAFSLNGERHEAPLLRTAEAYDNPWYLKQQIPILVSRLDAAHISYDAAWHLRPEGRRRLAPIAEMVRRSSEESRQQRTGSEPR